MKEKPQQYLNKDYKLQVINGEPQSFWTDKYDHSTSEGQMMV